MMDCSNSFEENSNLKKKQIQKDADDADSKNTDNADDTTERKHRF